MRDASKAPSQEARAASPSPPPRVETPEYTSNFGPPTATASHASQYGQEEPSNFKSEALVTAEDMMDIVDVDYNENSGEMEQPRGTNTIAPATTGFNAPFPYAGSNTAVDLRSAIKTLYESNDYFAASCIRLLGQQMYSIEFEEVLLTVHGVPKVIPAQEKTLCSNRLALEHLEKAYKNAGAIEGKQAARMVKMAVEEVYGVGVMDGMIATWEEANEKAMK